jgi:predicted acyltransferase
LRQGDQFDHNSPTTMSSAPAFSTQNSLQRLVYLDALRGFDMCWILGLHTVFAEFLQSVLPEGDWKRMLLDQFTHVSWAGFHFYDLIFPLFLFISGISIALTLPKRLVRDGSMVTKAHLFKRVLVLCFLGVIASGGWKDGVENVRWLGVLQRIGIATFVASLITMRASTAVLFTTTSALLLGYYGLLVGVPVPGVDSPSFDEGKNLANYLDSIWLAGRKYNGTHDPEGILSTLPAIATALTGVIAGRWIGSGRDPRAMINGLLSFAVLCLTSGWYLSPYCPIIKKIWTPTFVLFSTGWSLVLTAFFFWLIEVQRIKRWSTPFTWVGANPIVLYMAGGLGIFKILTERMIGKPDAAHAWHSSAVAFMLMLLLARWMYRRQIFIRI